MSELWWCINCHTKVELDIHGRCSHCASEAVDSMERLGNRRKPMSVSILALVELPQ